MRKIIIAGTGSGVGKTTVTVAIMRALTLKGVKVSPYKSGPDFIDPKFHTVACNTPSHNLDTVLNTPETVKYLFKKNFIHGSMAVIEGVMGLYDGCGFQSTGSTAELSLLLDAPVILILDAKAACESIAAVILGFKNYDPRVKIKGVILNYVHGDEFYCNIKRLVYEKTGIQCVGYLNRKNMPKLDERHLGLVPVEELTGMEEYMNSLAVMASKTVDIDAIEKIADENDGEVESGVPEIPHNAGNRLRIGIARDRAFNFYYEDNLSLMKETGMELVPFSPLADNKIPDGIDGLYIGGGFPEVFSKQLAENRFFLCHLREKLEEGLPCYAECGGLMYLTKHIKNKQGVSHGMTGFFNAGSVMTDKLQRFGYVDVIYDDIMTRAHEFHYSELEYENENNFEFKYNVKKTFGDIEWVCGLARKNVLAGYAHVHFYSNFKFYKKIRSLYGVGR